MNRCYFYRIPSWREGLKQWKISNDSIGNRTCGLQACSAERQPTAPPRTPNNSVLSGLTSISLAFFPHMFRTILRTNSNCCIKEQKTVALCNVGAVFSVRKELNFLMVCGWTYWLQRFERLCYVIVSFFINIYVRRDYWFHWLTPYLCHAAVLHRWFKSHIFHIIWARAPGRL